MILLPASVLSISLVALLRCASSPVSAQQTYLNNHHQWLFDYDGLANTRMDAVAIDTVADPDGILDTYIFTGNMHPAILGGTFQRPVLVKLGRNQPDTSPFFIEWAKTYLEPDETELQLTVRDVSSVSETWGETRFILCGQMYRVDADGSPGPKEAFLLLTDMDGNPIRFKTYKNVLVLNSVIPFIGRALPGASSSFAAVGQMKSDAIESGEGGAAFLNTDGDLTVNCLHSIVGDFMADSNHVVTGKFHQIIPFGKGFAMVGETRFENPEYPIANDSNVLLARANTKCQVSKMHHYGKKPMKNQEGKDVTYDEIGTSLAAFKKKILFTGSIRMCTHDTYEALCETEEIDVLYVQLRPSFSPFFIKQYDFPCDFNENRYDAGKTILYRGSTKSVLIGGEATTRNVLVQNNEVSTDIFLMELKLTGAFKKAPEVFGSTCVEEYHVDMVLSPDNNAVMLSNGPEPSGQCTLISSPWLIERYDSVSKYRCNDIPYKPTVKNTKLPKWKAVRMMWEAEEEEVGLVAVDVMMVQQTFCQKVPF